MNEELWCIPGQERQALKNWFKWNNIPYDDNLSTEELRQYYIEKVVN